MDAAARVSSKGQITLPKAVRDALDIQEGDDVVFRVQGNSAVLAKTPDSLELRIPMISSGRSGCPPRNGTPRGMT